MGVRYPISSFCASVDGGGTIRIHERMIRPLRTASLLLFFVFALSLVGCSTLYRRQVYHPGKSNYKKPPEKVEAVADLLPPEPEPGAPNAAQGLIEPAAPAAPAAPAPGMLDAAPAIPGLPQL